MNQLPLQSRPRHAPYLAALMVGALTLVGCRCGEGGTHAHDGAASAGGQVEPHVIKGTVRDASGKPLPNVTVTAWDAMKRWDRVEGVSDAQGRYSIPIDPERVTQYHLEAEMRVPWDGQQWRIKLHPENQQKVSHEGGLRDLVWRVSGSMPGAGFYGGSVQVFGHTEEVEFEFKDVELDFVPKGPRIDGSAGEPFTMKLADGNLREDVPLGRYTVTARVAGANPRPLRLRVYDQGAFVPELDMGFKSHDGWADSHLQVTAD